jgi:hypothetical protein
MDESDHRRTDYEGCGIGEAVIGEMAGYVVVV